MVESTPSGISVFGIRHHGPGSARSLLYALDAFRPDIILVEGPPDAGHLIPLATHADMQPPVAILVYNPKNLEQASFFPFAEFSPEWQAMRFGLARRIPVRFMDLPMSMAFNLREKEHQSTPELPGFSEIPDLISHDPFRQITLLAGYTDPERWWDAMLERRTVDGRRWTVDGGRQTAKGRAGGSIPDSEVAGQPEGGAVFSVILDLIRALRDAKNRPESPETLLREAFMRQTIRAAQKEGYRKIAVVCGAWHSPALTDVGKIKSAEDATLLKGLKKTKTEATWIPWSFDRLAAQSGYSAGVIAPAWYRVLWNWGVGIRDLKTDVPSESPIPDPQSQWLVQVARFLREKDFNVSPAHIIEAVRLAENLAALRNTVLPGIEELREAAVTVLCDGAEKPLELIDRQLVIGDVLGSVPASLPTPPLKADFEAQARSCRLEKNTQEKTLELDLREETHWKKSRLLHRLDLLGIFWGAVQDTAAGKQGRFHEHWRLKWLPDFEIRLIEAGAWGNTVEDAASRRAHRRVRDSENLPELTQLLGVALKADLAAIVPDLLQKLRNISALAKDALLLADAVLPLAEVLRYGSARRLNLDAVEQLLGRIIPRVCIQLPTACAGIDEDAAADILKKILAVNRALGILQVAEYEEQWTNTLNAVIRMNNAAPLLSGLTTRLLFDKNIRSATQTGDTMHFQLSHASSPASSVQWLEGFLYGSGLLLLHHDELRRILDDWVRELSEENFTELLPLLRRSFSRFSPPERQKMLDLAKNATPAGGRQNDDEWDLERAEGVLTLVRGILKE